MKVHVVGASGTFPAPGQPAAGLVIEQGGTRVWCDAGPGTFMSLPMNSYLIDAVVVSHEHLDHCADLLTTFHAWTWTPDPRLGVPLYAPRPVWDKLCAFIDTEPECFEFHEIASGDKIEFGEVSAEFVEMDHPVLTFGSRWVANNRTLFYTADTGPEGSWRDLARDVHLLIAEASFQGDVEDKEFSQHLTASEVGTIGREIGAKELVLTHIPPYLDKTVSVTEAESTFGKPVRLAVPGVNFQV